MGALTGLSGLSGLSALVGFNTQPIITVPGAQSVDSDATLTFEDATLISIADAEDNNQTVTLAVSHGTLTLSQTTGLSFDTGDGTADATMTFTGSLTNVNAALDGLIYDPTNSYGGADTLTVDSTDALGVAAEQKTVAIAVSLGLQAFAIAAYEFESGALETDATAGGYDLTNTNSVTSVSGKVGNAASFTGASSMKLSNADLSLAGAYDWTIAAWAKPGGDAPVELICGETSGGGGRIEVVFHGNTVRLLIYDGVGTKVATKSITVTGGVWYCVAATYSTATKVASLYVNADAAETVTLDGDPSIIEAGAFVIGDGSEVGYGAFTGLVDQCFVFRTASGDGGCLTADQVAALYNGGDGRTWAAIE